MPRALLFCLLITSWPLAAQEAPPAALGQGTFLTLGLGVPIYTVRDKLNSPLAYRGKGVNVRVEMERVWGDWLSQTRLSFSTGALKPRVKPRRDVNKAGGFSDLRVTTGLYRRLGSPDETDDNAQYAGLSLALNIDDRSYPLPTNNTGGNHTRVGFRLGVLDRRGLGDGGRWALTSQVDVPVLTKLYRPTYIGISPFLHLPKIKGSNFWKYMKWRGPGGFLGLEARFAADYMARPFRSDRLEYAFWLGYTPEPHPKSLLFTASQLSYAYRARL